MLGKRTRDLVEASLYFSNSLSFSFQERHAMLCERPLNAHANEKLQAIIDRATHRSKQ